MATIGRKGGQIGASGVKTESFRLNLDLPISSGLPGFPGPFLANSTQNAIRDIWLNRRYAQRVEHPCDMAVGDALLEMP